MVSRQQTLDTGVAERHSWAVKTTKRKDVVVFNGILFTRYPDAKSRSTRLYYYPSLKNQKKGIGCLHVEIYKTHFGAVPDGFHVHHRDTNPLNNAPDNLLCLSASDHNKAHAEDASRKEFMERASRRFRRLQRQQVEWRTQTPEGKAWLKKNVRKFQRASLKARGRFKIKCEFCGRDKERAGQREGTPAKYCSKRCYYEAWVLRTGKRKPPQPFTCSHCGKQGVTSRTNKRFCDAKCKSAFQWAALKSAA